MKKAILMLIGTITLVLGVAGIFLPLLPTTPFLLVSLWCFVRSSEKMYTYIMTNERLAPYVSDIVSGRGIPQKTKVRAIGLIWLTIGSSVIFFVDKWPVRGFLLATALVVSIYIATRKTPDQTSTNGEQVRGKAGQNDRP